MIKQLLFDCGGVFAELNFESLMTEVSGDPALGKRWVEMLWQPESPWLPYDQGLHKTEEMPALLHQYLPEFSEEVIAKFLPLWAKRMPTLPGMETIVREVQAAGTPCYLLSNWNRQFEDFKEHHPAIQGMDGYVISYKVNMLKPHREIFEYTAKALKIEPCETLFIDDTLANIEAAQAVGYQGHHFRDGATLREALK